MSDEKNLHDEFYWEQFKTHSQRIFEYQKDRLKLSLLAITGTSAYFAWIGTHPPLVKAVCIKALIYFLPAIFCFVGWIYNIFLNILIERHGEFLDFIEVKILKLVPEGWKHRSAWKTFRDDIDTTRLWGKPLKTRAHVFWALMIIISISVGISLFQGARP